MTGTEDSFATGAGEASANGTGAGSYTASGWRGGDTRSELKDRLSQAKDSAQRLYDRTIGQRREQLGDGISQVRDGIDDAVALINRRPLAAIGVAAVIGLTLGLLLNSGKSRVVLVEKAD